MKNRKKVFTSFLILLIVSLAVGAVLSLNSGEEQADIINEEIKETEGPGQYNAGLAQKIEVEEPAKEHKEEIEDEEPQDEPVHQQKPEPETKPKPEPVPTPQPQPAPDPEESEQETAPEPSPDPEPKPEAEPQEPEPIGKIAPEDLPGYSPDAEEILMLNLVNEERVNAGLHELQMDNRLGAMARIKSRELIELEYWSHDSPVYGSPFEMMRYFGVTYTKAAETLAKIWSTEHAHLLLMNSDGHRAAILNPEFTHIGIGIVQRKNLPYRYFYFTQMFIRKP